MKNLFIPLMSLALMFAACEKENGTTTPDSSTDSLSAGWTKINVYDSDTSVYREGMFDNIAFSNNNIGFATKQERNKETYKEVGSIYSTKDGGITWTKNITVTPQGQTTLAWFTDLFVTPAETMFATNVIQIYKKSKISDIDSLLFLHPQSNLPYKATPIESTFFINENSGYTLLTPSTSDRLLKTVDGGKTWNAIPNVSFPEKVQTHMFFINENTGWITKHNTVYRTSGSDASWKQSILPNSADASKAITNIQALNKDIVFMGSAHAIYKSNNGGESFIKLTATTSNPAMYNVHAFYFINELVGYQCNLNQIYKTVDGGITWVKEVHISQKNTWLRDIYFTDENHGWACGSNGTILKYTK